MTVVSSEETAPSANPPPTAAALPDLVGLFGYGSILNTSTHAVWFQNNNSPHQKQDAAATAVEEEPAAAADGSTGSDQTPPEPHGSSANNNHHDPPHAPSSRLPGRRAVLQGYQRSWNFRSNTGFTALGLVQQDDSAAIQGVLFLLPAHRLPDMDRREVGYDRVLLNTTTSSSSPQLELLEADDNDDWLSSYPCYVYVPQPAFTQTANAQYPLLQSYIDTVLQGCLEWDDNDENDETTTISLAHDFCQHTLHWGGRGDSEEGNGATYYYLDDTPNSRRPWLFRPSNYTRIDALLQQHVDVTHVDHRKHSEDYYASSHGQQQASTPTPFNITGLWFVPRRNPVFTGRETELRQLHALLQPASPLSASANTNTNAVSLVQVVGMGGVGKSQLVTEYCYRYYSSSSMEEAPSSKQKASSIDGSYGLVVWLRASSAETIVAGYRQFILDNHQTMHQQQHTTDAVSKKSRLGSGGGSPQKEETDNETADEVVAQVKAYLFRRPVPWLLVFDNLEETQLLDKFLPHAAGASSSGQQHQVMGHVLVTTRRLLHPTTTDSNMSTDTPVAALSEEHSSTLILNCFNPNESLELLCRIANICDDDDDDEKDSAVEDRTVQRGLSRRQQNLQAAQKLAVDLGHLPLALSMAAAYMRNCDVECSEYLDRYRREQKQSRKDGARKLGHEAVVSSLKLSLKAIWTKDLLAWETLRLLGFLGPDQITRKLVRSLLVARSALLEAKLLEEQDVPAVSFRSKLQQLVVSRPGLLAISVVAGISVVSVATVRPPRYSTSVVLWASVGMISTVALLSAMPITQTVQRSQSPRSKPSLTERMSIVRNNSFPDVYEQTDQIWKLLKSFSILTVKEGKGTMHRLLAHALQSSQGQEEAIFNLKICLEAVSQEWSFKPEQADTWQESLLVLEHVKTLIAHAVDLNVFNVEIATLAKEAGVFSAMTLNRFEEAQVSLEQSLRVLDSMDDSTTGLVEAKGASLHELGRVLRYQGKFQMSEKALEEALEVRRLLSREVYADTLYELGVLEVKKHSLDSATDYLQRALDIRRDIETEAPNSGLEADCAATLHQLAAVKVAQKPPALDEAELLLKEALGLNMQIGQRAATLKQLARVAIRRGDFDIADQSLSQALDLYVELYGDDSLHINVAAVKFQQGALSFQREQFDAAWHHFSECLAARHRVYEFSHLNHLEVSSVLHELACVAFAQQRVSKACEMLHAEKDILDQLFDTSGQRERLLQARLTNLTWLRKCAKEAGDEEEVRKLTAERSALKRNEKSYESKGTDPVSPNVQSLHREALRCRLVARQFALCKCSDQKAIKNRLNTALSSLKKEIDRSVDSVMRTAAMSFYRTVSASASEFLQLENIRPTILEACDDLRDVLRDQGFQVNDTAQGKAK